MTNKDLIWIASFDIGKLNFAFYVEEFDKTALLNLPFILQKNRYNADGTTTPEFGEILKQVCGNGKMILFKNCNLTAGCKKGSYLDTEVFYNLTDLLDKYTSYFDKCETILIEKQMSFKNKQNTLALKIGQHTFSYFAIRYSRFKYIIEFPAYHKTQILGAAKIVNRTKAGKITYKAIDKHARKKWTKTMSLGILAERNDFDTISYFTSQKKQDDLADVLCQLQAYKILKYIDK